MNHAARLATNLAVTTLIAPLVLTAGCAPGEPNPASDAEDRLAIRNVTVVDVTDGSLRPGHTVVIEGTWITEIGPAADIDVEGVAEVFDGAGGYLVPGLFDMHVHLFAPWGAGVTTELRRHLESGVLGVRDMGMPVDSIPRLRAIVDSDSTPAPRVWYSGPMLEQVENAGPVSMTVADTAEAQRVVESLSAAGATSIKVHDRLSPEVYSAVTRAARRVGLPVVGHIPVTVTPDQVIAANQRSMEHLGQTPGLVAGCSARGALDPETSRRLMDEWPFYSVSTEYLSPVLAGFDPGRCQDLAARLAEAEVWQVPTLVMYESLSSSGFRWSPPENWPVQAELPPIMSRITAILDEAGVPIMTGTDQVGSIHDELELLVGAGLSPADALRAATLSPATFLGVADSIGLVAPGYTADLLILDGNPMEDIGNTRRIRSIVLGGRLLQPGEFD